MLQSLVDTVDSLTDIATGLSPWVAGQSRFDPRHLSARELSASIAAGVAGARLERVNVEDHSRGTTDRARLLLQWNEAGMAAGLPQTAFAKGTASGTAQRVLGSVFGLAEYEARFYGEVQPAVAELTLTPYLVRWGRGGRYLILLEDLGARPDATFYQAGDEPPLSHSLGLMDAFGALHGRFWCSPRFDRQLSWVTVDRRLPGHALTPPLLRLCAKRFLAQDRDLPQTVRRLTELCMDGRPELDRAREALPYTLIHGDSHTGNTYALGDGRSGLYDWQRVHRANGIRDVAYYIAPSLSTESRRAHERQLLECYLDRLAASGAGSATPTYAQAYDIYRLMMVDSWIAIVATLAIGGMQDEERTEIAAARCVDAMVDLETEEAVRNAIRHG